MTDHPTSPGADQPEPTIERLRLASWTWRPWYAKLWWSLITAYWAGALSAPLFGTLREFYGSDLAGYLNIALYPVFTLFILSIGWLIAWTNALDYVAEHPEIDNTLGWHWSAKQYDFESRMMRRHNDLTDPTSRSYIANATLRMFRRQ